MDISIGKGIDDILFGQAEKDIITSLGRPNKKYFDELGDIYLKYNSLETTFKLEKENDYRLGWIETSSFKTNLLDVSPWGIPKNDLIERLTQALGESPEVEDYGSFESVTYNNAWLELQIIAGC